MYLAEEHNRTQDQTQACKRQTWEQEKTERQIIMVRNFQTTLRTVRSVKTSLLWMQGLRLQHLIPTGVQKKDE